LRCPPIFSAWYTIRLISSSPGDPSAASSMVREIRVMRSLPPLPLISPTVAMAPALIMALSGRPLWCCRDISLNGSPEGSTSFFYLLRVDPNHPVPDRRQKLWQWTELQIYGLHHRKNTGGR